LLIRKTLVAPDDPVGELLTHLKCLPAVAIDIHIEQARVDLVQGIVRRPNTPARLDTIDKFLRVGAQITATHFDLALGQARNDGVTFLSEPLVTGAGIHHCTCRQVMPDRMPS